VLQVIERLNSNTKVPIKHLIITSYLLDEALRILRPAVVELKKERHRSSGYGVGLDYDPLCFLDLHKAESKTSKPEKRYITVKFTVLLN